MASSSRSSKRRGKAPGRKRAHSEKTAATPVKNKGGRPKFLVGLKEQEQIERLAGLGLTETQIALTIGCSPRTFTKKKGEDDVSAALERGKAVAAANVGEALYVRAQTGDVAAIRWYEMTRQGRTERSHVQTQQLPPIVVRRER